MGKNLLKVMKNIHLISILILVSFNASFATLQEEDVTGCDSINTELTSKFKFLGGWDSNGTPDYLQPESGDVSQALINYVKETLPESVNLPDSDGEYFGDDVQLNTELTDTSEVYLTMVHEGAGWKNTLGFYTYDINNPPSTVYDIDSLVIVFPNVSQLNVVKPGDKVLLGEFPKNTGIGYFLIAKGWVGDTICLTSHIVFTDKHLNTFTTEEYRQQTILLNYEQEEQLLLSFEDIKRPNGDNDFNDAVFYITAEPGAIDPTNIPKIPTASISGDTTVCDENDPAIIKVELSGQAPWTLVYSNGSEEIEISDIEESVIFFETTIKDTIALISVKDKNKLGIVDGEAIIKLSSLSAVIEDLVNSCGDEAATVNIALTGEGPWTVYYNMNGESNSSDSNEDLLSLSIDQSGTFELVGVEDLYCEYVAEGSIEIENYAAPTALFSDDVVVLCKDEEATIQISLTGTAPFTFVYTDGENETTVTTEDNLYEFITSEFVTFTLVSIDDANCSVEADGSVTISDGSEDIQVEIDADENACFGEDIELALLGDTDELTIVWSTEGKGTFENIDQLETSYKTAENEVGVIVFYAEVNNGCAIKTVSKEVNIVEEIDASFSVSPDKDLLTNTLVTFTPTNNNYDEYEWEFGDENSSTATISSTEYVVGGIYTVELLVKFAGCEGTGSTELEVLSKDELYVPNVFNPTAQHPENRVVKVYGNNIDDVDFSFKIVNRWGKMMYQTNSFDEANSIGWNGVNNTNNEEQELNVFTYILKGRFIEGKSFEKTGTITQVK